MSLEDVVLPKKYKNGKVLFEQNLDAWRRATEQGFQTVNLNLTQLQKDLFLSTYQYTNNGDNQLSQSLQEQINLLASGGTPITGTTSDSFTINSDGNAAILSTSSLTAIRTQTFPDASGEFTLNDATQTLTNKTITSAVFSGTMTGTYSLGGTPTIVTPKITGAGSGVSTLQYTNSSSNRTGTIPDVGENFDFVVSEDQSQGWVYNLGVEVASGGINFVDSKGGALSSTNAAYISVPSSSAGRSITLKVTAAADFTAAQTSGYGWGITEASDWGQDVPFSLYVVNRGDTDISATDGESKFFIARNWDMTLTPSSSNSIGDTSAVPVTDDQNGIIILGTVTEGNYTSLPCQWIGWIRMQWSSGSTRWTVQTLSTQKDGLGLAAKQRLFQTTFIMPSGQNGASSGCYVLPNGGTAPTYGDGQNSTYYIRPGGLVRCVFEQDNSAGGTSGSGVVNFRVAAPLKCITLNSASAVFRGGALYVNGGAENQNATCKIASATTYFEIYKSDTAVMLLDDQNNASRQYQLDIEYKAY